MVSDGGVGYGGRGLAATNPGRAVFNYRMLDQAVIVHAGIPKLDLTPVSGRLDGLVGGGGDQFIGCALRHQGAVDHQVVIAVELDCHSGFDGQGGTITNIDTSFDNIRAIIQFPSGIFANDTALFCRPSGVEQKPVHISNSRAIAGQSFIAFLSKIKLLSPTSIISQ